MFHLPFGLSIFERMISKVFLAISAELSGVTGQYFFNNRRVRSKRMTYDAEVADRLWSVSERLTSAEQPAISAAG